MGDVKKGLRTVRNVVHNYNDSQVKVREATSNDPWGPAASLMSEISDMTYNHLAFSDIMQMLWKRLNDNGKDWRHVYKALVVLDYIIKAGTEKVAQHCKENLYFIQTLTNFQYFEENKDHGMNVREKAKQVVALLTDEERLKNERIKAQKTRERFSYGSQRGEFTEDRGGSPSGFSGDHVSFGGSPAGGKLPAEIEGVRPQTANEEEIQLQIALAMSKEEAEEEERRRQRDDVRLQMALSESQTDYQKHKPVAVSSANELFDVFVMPHQSQNAAPDPWAPVGSSGSFDSHGSTNGFSNGNNGHLNHHQVVANDPWSTPSLSSPSMSSMPMPSHPPPGQISAAAATLNPWSSLTPTNSSNSKTTSPSNVNSSSRSNAAENFLGQNSSLVNLDSLITAPARPNPAPSAAYMNPFATTTVSGNAAASPVPNPFHQMAAPAPTINQLRNTNVNPYDSGFLPQPLQPMSTTPTPVSQQQSRFQPQIQPQQQTQSQTNYNPFL